jgi:Zn-dependent M28 family amino/carboxypeptidase
VQAGCVGFIFSNAEVGTLPPTGSLGFGGQPAPLPGVGIAYESYLRIERMLESGEQTAHLRVDAEVFPATGLNVIADIPGTSKSKDYVVVGSHYDGHDISQGAEDPCSGTVTVMEIARNLQMVKSKLKRRVRCVCFGAEEIGLFGSYNYTAMHADELDDARFMLNLDSGGSKTRKGVILHDFPELEPFMDRCAKEMKAELPYFERVGPYSDHWPFYLRSVPCGSGGDPETIRTSTGRGFGHSKYDTVDKVDLEYLRLAAANYTRFLFRVANEDKWMAKRKTKQEIQDFIKKQGYDQTVQLAEKAKAYIKTWPKMHPETKVWVEGKSEW